MVWIAKCHCTSQHPRLVAPPSPSCSTCMAAGAMADSKHCAPDSRRRRIVTVSYSQIRTAELPIPTAPPTSSTGTCPASRLIGNVQIPANAPDDVQFFRDAIRQLEQAACADPHRLYVTGFSGGARMASALACEESDSIAAVAPVSGLRAGAPRAGDLSAPDAKTCAPHRAVAIITFHGVHDPTNPFNGDGTARWGYSVPVALERWGHLDGCHKSPSEQKVSTHVTKVAYGGCRDGAELILYRTDAPVEHGGGHIWPHASTSARESASADQVDQLDASELIWKFFSRH